jgi:hypothetical protein
LLEWFARRGGRQWTADYKRKSAKKFVLKVEKIGMLRRIETVDVVEMFCRSSSTLTYNSNPSQKFRRVACGFHAGLHRTSVPLHHTATFEGLHPEHSDRCFLDSCFFVWLNHCIILLEIKNTLSWRTVRKSPPNCLTISSK